jgi:hypothetical protein
MIICVDFDGTIVEHAYPAIGEPVPLALDIILELQKQGHGIILFTMRHGETLDAAVEYLTDAGIRLYGVNENPKQKEWTESPKVYGHHYIDDAAIGCPLIFKEGRRPYVDWYILGDMLRQRGLLSSQKDSEIKGGGA